MLNVSPDDGSRKRSMRRATCGIEHIGADEPDGRRAAEAGHPDQPHPGQKEKCAPDQCDQHCLPEVRLQHEAGYRERQQGQRNGIRRHLRPARGFPEQPRHQDDKGRLEELRGLQIDTQKDDPAARTLHLGTVMQGGDDEHEAHHEYKQRKPANISQRQE